MSLSDFLSDFPGFRVYAASEPAQDPKQILCSKLKACKLELDPKKITYMGRDGIDYDGNVRWTGKLPRIPVRFRKVTGYFFCGLNVRLVSLENAPVWVGGDFSCLKSSLSSLEHAPEYVGGHFDCGFNNLTSLDHAPAHVQGDFYCHNNRLPRDTKPPKGVKGKFVLGEQTPAPAHGSVHAAQAPDRNDHSPIRAYVDELRKPVNKKPIDIGNGIQIRFRTNAKSKKYPGTYLLKYAVLHSHEEIPDLELVLYTMTDDIVGSFQARRIRMVAKSQEYKYTAKDEVAFLSTNPHTVALDIKNLFKVGGDLNHLVRNLYDRAIHHLQARHVENERPNTAKFVAPFDYAMEVKKHLAGRDIHIDAEIQARVREVTALKNGEDVVIKFDTRIPDLNPTVKDLSLNLYLTTDSLSGGVLIRKTRFHSKAKDYSDSDDDHQISLDEDSGAAAHDLRENMEGGPLGDVIREMALRAKFSLNGGEQLDGPDSGDDDSSGGGIDWNELGLEDPTK